MNTKVTESTPETKIHVPYTTGSGVEATAPGTLRVIRRDGALVEYDQSRIATAMKKAFVAVKGNEAMRAESIHKTINALTEEVSERLRARWPEGGVMHLEAIQDAVEVALMRAQEYEVARAYVVYREQHRRQREQRTALGASVEPLNINITLEDGSKQPLDIEWLARLAINACDGIENVAPTQIIEDTRNNLFDGVALKDVYQALTLSARTLIETEPHYTYVTARLLLQKLYRETLETLHVNDRFDGSNIDVLYPDAFKAFIQRGIEAELLHPTMADFDLNKLGAAIQATRDEQFAYLGIQTLYDRYFIHQNGRRIELPQVFFMRVAMGLAHCEGDARNERAIEFYELLSQFDFLSSTPTLFNSGTMRPQLSSCFLTTVADDLSGIYDAIKNNAMLSKYAGGLGNDWTPVRGMGAHIKSTNGKSLGIVPFLKVAEATMIAVNQSGKRKGSGCMYLENFHIDTPEFLELRKNTGDERRRTPDINTAMWIPDLFMIRLHEGQDWMLFSPDETPDLHELYGPAFEEAYLKYEEKAKKGEIRGETIPAKQLWRKMLTLLFETGHPWVTFKDSCNIRSPQQHAGVIHSSNLCTEITLNTSKDEVAVCNLGSINLPRHMKDGKLDRKKLAKTIKTAIRMLDNVIDINFYPIPEAENSNKRHRPIGMGMMGFQDALYEQRIPYASKEAVEFADECMEYISYEAITASTDLAEERGTYESYKGSLWDQGILPIDSINLLEKARGSQYLNQDRTQRLDWDSLRKRVKKVGMRNSNVMAIAPTATIANISGVTQSIEPTYQNLFVKSNLSGEFTVVNPYLVRDLKERDLWDSAMVHDLKYYNGSVQAIERIPQDLKALYATAFEIEPEWILECASRRQKWIDQAQSLNLYMAEPSGKKLNTIYRLAWTLGLKTTYYLRTLGATDTEKATIDDGQLNAVNTAPKACAIDDPDCEACQ